MPPATGDGYSQILDLANFIAGPLTALVEADAMAADTFLRFLETVAFEPVGDEPSVVGDEVRLGRLRYVTFTYDHVQNGKPTTSSIKVPLLSLLPLPALQVKEGTFDFAVEILAVMQQQDVPRLKSGIDTAGRMKGTSGGTTQPPSRLMAAIGSSPGATPSELGQVSTSARMNVHVTMASADIPAGLQNLLNLTSWAGGGSTPTPNSEE